MTDPTPIPEADGLLIPWPTVRPLGFRVTAQMAEESWNEIFKPIYEDGPQSGEARVMAGMLRAVFDGLHGIVTTMEPEPLSPGEFYMELVNLADSLDDHVTAQDAAAQLHLLAERLTRTAPEIWEGTEG